MEDDGDCPTASTTGEVSTADAGEGCTNDAGTDLSGSFQRGLQQGSDPLWAWWEFEAWSVEYSDENGFIDEYAEGRVYHEFGAAPTLDAQIWYQMESGGTWQDPLDDSMIYEDLSATIDGDRRAWSGYTYVVLATWSAGSGDFCVEADVTWSESCEEEPDGEVLLEADHDYRWVLDGSTACDGCGTLFVDGVESGAACL